MAPTVQKATVSRAWIVERRKKLRARGSGDRPATCDAAGSSGTWGIGKVAMAARQDQNSFQSPLPAAGAGGSAPANPVGRGRAAGFTLMGCGAGACTGTGSRGTGRSATGAA